MKTQSHKVLSAYAIKIILVGITINDSKITGFDSKMKGDLKKAVKLQQ